LCGVYLLLRRMANAATITSVRTATVTPSINPAGFATHERASSLVNICSPLHNRGIVCIVRLRSFLGWAGRILRLVRHCWRILDIGHLHLLGVVHRNIGIVRFLLGMVGRLSGHLFCVRSNAGIGHRYGLCGSVLVGCSSLGCFFVEFGCLLNHGVPWFHGVFSAKDYDHVGGVVCSVVCLVTVYRWHVCPCAGDWSPTGICFA
jgi:hypothetical protein